VPTTNLNDLLADRAEEHGDATAFTSQGRTLTFHALHDRARKVAGALHAAGVQPADRVAYLGANRPEFFELLFGAARAGAVTVGVNWRLTPREIQDVLSDAGARVLILTEEYQDHVDQIRGALPQLAETLVIGHDVPNPYVAWRDARDPADSPEYAAGRDDVALQVYTSGTTGRSKGAMLTHGNLASIMDESSALLEFDTDAVGLCCLPVFHISGAGMGLFGVYAGCNTVVTDQADPVSILDAVEEHRLTHLLLVPALIQFILDVPDLESRDVSSVEWIVYGGSPIAPDVLRRALEAFPGTKFMQAYGLSETAGGCVFLMPEDHDPGHPQRLESAGKPLASCRLRIVDPETLEDLPAGQVGEVWIASPQVMAGYWNKPDATEEAIVEGGWFRSGDAGSIDGGGYLSIRDRVKDMIVSGGENIYPAEVEAALIEHPDVADIAIVGIPSERWGETVLALVVPVSGATIEADELIAWSRKRLAHYKCPTRVEVTDELPRTPTGKIRKNVLREPYWAGHDRRVG